MAYAIKNWGKFQHYKDRNPPWIKLYEELLDDAEFRLLDHFSQLLYFKLLLAASRKDNQIPEDPAWMATELSLPKRRIQQGLEVLLITGFLASDSASTSDSNGASRGASKPASPSRAPAPSREAEAEAEAQKPAFLPADQSYEAGQDGWRSDDELDALAETFTDSEPNPPREPRYLLAQAAPKNIPA